MQKWIVSIALLLLLIGLFWPWLLKLPFGRLPGDITIQGENYVFRFPLTTCLLVSLLLSLAIWAFRRLGL